MTTFGLGSTVTTMNRESLNGSTTRTSIVKDSNKKMIQQLTDLNLWMRDSWIFQHPEASRVRTWTSEKINKIDQEGDADIM